MQWVEFKTNTEASKIGYNMSFTPTSFLTMVYVQMGVPVGEKTGSFSLACIASLGIMRSCRAIYPSELAQPT